MDLDDLEPRRAPVKPKDLSGLSVEELEEYIARLQAEIVRAQDMAASKRKARSGADSIFRR